MLQFGRVLQRQELDAFLAMSVSPLLHDVQTMQDLKLPSVHPRGVALAALFMAGVETAQCTNDVCGAPIPWNMVCPWQYFDGKLFHFKLLKANNNTPLIDMCDGQVRNLNMKSVQMNCFSFFSQRKTSCILPNYCTYPYKRTVKQFRSLQITASVLFVYFFIKAYFVDTHLNCIDLSMQFI